jgi:hypothetical protein
MTKKTEIGADGSYLYEYAFDTMARAIEGMATTDAPLRERLGHAWAHLTGLAKDMPEPFAADLRTLEARVTRVEDVRTGDDAGVSNTLRAMSNQEVQNVATTLFELFMDFAAARTASGGVETESEG